MNKEDGPLLDTFNKKQEGVIMQELVTYYIRDGIMIKETVQRQYSKDDYMDSTTIQPLVQK